MSWKNWDILKRGDCCFPDCFPSRPGKVLQWSKAISIKSTSIESLVEKQSVEIPPWYYHFKDLFCLKRASQLPTHRPWDCAIVLFPGEPMPCGKIKFYSLNKRSWMSMWKRLYKKATSAHQLPLLLPVFFIVAKKDGGLMPCIDYCHLNSKFSYPNN